MATTATQRGWTLPSPTVRVSCPGIPLNLRPEVAPLFAALISRVDAVKGAGFMQSSGGLNARPVRGYEDRYQALLKKGLHDAAEELLSNHSWALAADFRAGTNPMGTSLRTDMPSDISAIADSCGLQWGGDYLGRKDPMHFEFIGTPAEAKAAVAALTSKDDFLSALSDAEQRELLTRLRNLDGIVTRSGLGSQLTSLVDGKTKGYLDNYILWADGKLNAIIKKIGA